MDRGIRVPELQRALGTFERLFDMIHCFQQNKAATANNSPAKGRGRVHRGRNNISISLSYVLWCPSGIFID